MGIYDRDYYRRPLPRGGFAVMRMWSVTTWLILINVAVFIVDSILRPEVPRGFFAFGPLERWGYFSLDLAVLRLQLWRFLTFQFLHASVAHLFGNMLGLYFFGPIVESHFGPRRYLSFYLTCGFAGAGAYIALWASGILVTSPQVPLVGASAGVFGVLAGAAWLAPNTRVILFFPPIPMSLKTLACVMMGIAAWTVLFQGYNAGGEAAHLGGGLLGLIFMSNQHWLNPFSPWRKYRRKRWIWDDWPRQ